MSRFIYNGVELSYIRTKSITHEPEYDDTGVDYLWTKVTFDIEAVLNTTLGGSSPAQQIVAIRQALETPRKRLQFIVNTDTILDVNDTTDVRIGPLPEPCVVTQIGGEQTFLISYRISTWIVECVSPGLTPQYQSHRWKEAVRIDENFYTRKTRTGKLYVRSDIIANVDSLRDLGVVLPPLDNGFKLGPGGIEVTIQEDGLALMYSWEEQEVYLQPPAPATKAEGEYIESTNTPDGAIRYGECRVRLTGAKNSDQGALLIQAIIICLNTVSPTGKVASSADDSNPLLMSSAVRKSLYENQVEVTMKVFMKSGKGRTKQLGMDLGNFASIPKGSEPGTLPPDPGTRGTAAIKLFANALQDPCSPAQVQLSSQAGQQRALSTSGLPEVRVIQTKILPDDGSALYSTDIDNLPGFYTHHKMHTDYKPKTWASQLPVAAAGAASAIVVLAGTTAQKIIEGVVEKVGTAPKLPDPNVNDPNLVLLEAVISPNPLELSVGAGDGTMLTFRRAYRYVYAIIDVAKAVFDGGMPPFLDSQKRGLSTIQPGDFVHGLIDGASGGATLTTVPGQIIRQ